MGLVEKGGGGRYPCGVYRTPDLEDQPTCSHIVYHCLRQPSPSNLLSPTFRGVESLGVKTDCIQIDTLMPS